MSEMLLDRRNAILDPAITRAKRAIASAQSANAMADRAIARAECGIAMAQSTNEMARRRIAIRHRGIRMAWLKDGRVQADNEVLAGKIGEYSLSKVLVSHGLSSLFMSTFALVVHHRL